jgi:CHAD domain-containing protein
MEKQALHGFRIYRQETLSETYQRILYEQINYSIDLCKSYPDDPDFSTHEIRKSTKRIRSVYRLFQSALGMEAFQYGNEFYGNISRLLADHRVSKVHLEILQRFCEDQKLSLIRDYLKEEISTMEKQHVELTGKLFHKNKLDRQILQLLEDENNRLRTSVPASIEFASLAEGMQNTYKKAKQHLILIVQETNAENLHELRKKVKAIWNHLLLVRPLWPGYTSPAIRQFDLLAEKLGMEHDLSELENFMDPKKTQKNHEPHQLLMAHIAVRRRNIQKAIIPLASRLFVEKPGELARRMMEYHKLFITNP